MAALATCAFNTQVLAASGTWTSVTSPGTYSDTNNWAGGTVADGTDATADFNQVDIPVGAYTVNVDTARTIGNLIFGDTDTSTAGTWTLATAANTLTLGVTSGSPTITTNVNTAITGILGGSSTFVKNGSAQLDLSGLTAAYAGGVNVAAGTLKLKANAASNAVIAGAFTGSGTILVNQAAANTFQQLNDISGFTGTYQIDNGTFRFGTSSGVPANSGAGQGVTFNLGNGTMAYRNGSNSTVTFRIGALNGNAAATLSGGSASGTGFIVYQIGEKNIDSTFAGTTVDSLTKTQITKLGTGTLTLSGTLAHTGATTVSAGTLKVNGFKSGASALTVSSGATLTGTGNLSAGTNTISSGGHIAPGDGGVGTLTFGSLTLSSGSILDYEFNSATNYDQIITSGTLTINGGSFNLYNSGTTSIFATNGSYNLIGFNGTIAGTGLGALSVAAGSQQAGKTYQFNSSGGFVTLTIAGGGAPIYWNVDTSGTWGTGSNWTGGSQPNAIGAFAGFGGGTGVTISQPVTINVESNKTVGTLSFNSAQAYTLSGAGTITLNNDTVAAAITDSNGSHFINVPLALTANGVNANVVNAADTLTINGGISGSGGLTKQGAGKLTLTDANTTYSGTTTIVAGAVELAGASAGLGSGSVLNSGTLAFNRTTAFTFANAISGAGSISQIGSGVVTLTGSNAFTGTTSITSSAVKLGNTNAAQNSIVAVNVDNGLTFANGITNFNVGALSGSNAVALQDESGAGVQLTVGNNNSGATFSGVLSGTGSLVKVGSGTQVLASDNTYSGGTQINAGTLTLNASAALGTGTATLNGGTLRFNQTSAAGSITVNNSVNVTAASTISSSNKSNIFNGTVSGTGNLTVGIDSAGFFTPGGSWAAYTGTATIQPNSGSVTFRLENGFDAPNAAFVLNSGVTMSRRNGTNNTVTINLGSLSTSTGSTLSGALSAGGGQVTYSIGSLGLSSTLAGIVADGSTKLGLTKVGAGTLSLSNSNTFTGSITVSGGTLAATLGNNVDNPTSGALGNTQVARNITINSGGTLRFDAGDVMGSALTTGSATLVINNGGTVTNNGTSFNSLGPVTLNGGTLTGSGGSGNPSFQMYRFSGNVTVGGTTASTISVTGSGNATNGYHLGANTTFNVANATNDPTSDLNVSASLIDQTASQSGSAGALTKTGAGTMTLSGNNTYTGTTTVNAGTLQVAKQVALYSGTTASWTATNLTVASGATLAFNVGGTGEFTTSDIDTLKALGTATGGFQSGSALGIDTTNVTGGTLTYSSAIANTNGGTNALGFSKLGTGTLQLTASNTYTGVTTVYTGGTLALGANASIASSSKIVVGTISGSTAKLDVSAVSGGFHVVDGQTLAGQGSVAGAVTVNNGATLSPGDSTAIGNLTTDALTFAGSTAHLAIQLGQTTAGNPVAGTNNDVVTTNGAVSLNGADLALTLNTGFAVSGDNLYFIINNLSGQTGGTANLGQLSYNGTLLGQGDTFTVGSQDFQISYNADFATRTFVGVGNDIALQAVPEPGTWAMMIGGAGMLVGYQRMRRRK